MAYRILNELFYPDITNIILDYIMIDLKISKRIITMNVNYFNDIIDDILSIHSERYLDENTILYGIEMYNRSNFLWTINDLKI
jgi:hypothetical protein